MVSAIAAGCVGGPSEARSPDLEDPDYESASNKTGAGREPQGEQCSSEPPADTPPFDRAVAEGALNAGANRAAACGLHTQNYLDLTLALTWAPSGCVSDARLESKVPSAMGECLVRRFRESTIKPFSGDPVSVRVRMTNDRYFWQW